MHWYFTLSTFPLQGVFSTIKLLDYFQYKFLELVQETTLPKQSKTTNPAHHKNIVLKGEQSNFIMMIIIFPSEAVQYL